MTLDGGAFVATANDSSQQANIAGDNFGPIILSDRRKLHPIRQLPAVPADLVERRKEIGRILGWAKKKGPTRLINIYGGPATGKSTLAIDAAHRLSASFGQWQIYVDLRLPDGSPADAAEVLDGLLVSIGQASDEVPAGQHARSALFRSLVAGQRLTLLIDNATGLGHVEPLLPGSADALVMVTSWAPMPELAGASLLPLGLLDPGQSDRLLVAVSGRRSKSGDKDARLDVARIAGGYPLALRIAGAILRTHPHWSWSDLVRRLGSTADVVEGFSIGQTSLRTSFSLAYQDLTEPLAQGYRMLGLAPAAETDGDIARALVAADSGAAADLLDQLVVRQLLQHAGADRFRMHDLLWTHASRMVREVDHADAVEASITRMAVAILHRMRLDYVPRFVMEHDRMPSLDGTQTFSMEELYVEPSIDDGERRYPASEAFPQLHRRLLVVGAGGAGKTILLSRVCKAVAVGAAGPATVPLLLRARDLGGLRPGRDLEAHLISMLRYRYGIDLTSEVLRILLTNGDVLVAIDGIDEIPDPLVRARLLAAVDALGVAYPGTAIITTARELPGLAQSLPSFRLVRLAPWDAATARRFIDKLFATAWRPTVLKDYLDDESLEWDRRHWIAAAAEAKQGTSIATTPLGTLITAEILASRGGMPEGLASAAGLYLETILFRRDVRRTSRRVITNYFGPSELMTRLEQLAFHLQSNPADRTYMTRKGLWDILFAGVPEELADELVDSVVQDYGILVATGTQEDGQVFAFAHTAFREYLAAAHLARQSTGGLSTAWDGMPDDASWREVLRTALAMLAEHDKIGDIGTLARRWRRAGANGFAEMAEALLT